MGELLELVAVAGGVAGGSGLPWSFVGEFHKSSGLRSSRVGKRSGGKQGLYHRGLVGQLGSGVAVGSPVQVGRWDLCGLGHIGSRCSMVGSG